MPPAAEIELKLIVTRGRVADLRRRLPRTGLRRAQVDDLYFDTADGSLRGHGLVLRLRHDGRRWLQTLKAADRGAHVVSERGEWEFALGVGKGRPSLELGRFAGTPLGALIESGLTVDALVPIFRTRFVRRRLTLSHAASSIEVALDDGDLIAARGSRSERRPIAEVELELKSGTPADVMDLAKTLLIKGDATLVPALRSKAERGYALATTTPLSVARASAPGFAALMAPEISSGNALRAVIGHGLAVVVANADALRGTPAIEHLHQARVALRRMRSAIRLLDPQGTDVPGSEVRRLQKLAHVLGEARDWDVLCEATLPALLAHGAQDARVAGALAGSSRRLRAKSMEDVVKAVGSRRYARLVLGLGAWSMSESPPSPRLADIAGALLELLGDDVAAGARAFDGLSRDERHRLRIHAKRLRYALDLLRFALPAKGAAHYLDALGTLQDTLGALNDAAVARERLVRAISLPGGRRLVKDWFAAVEPPLVRKAARELSALARRKRPWHAAR